MVGVRLHRGRSGREALGGESLTREKPAFVAIGIFSAAALSFLFWLLYFRSEAASGPAWTSSLPAVNAGLNATSAMLLVAGVLAIRSGRRELHMKLMLSAFAVASTFLVSYIVYHHFHGDTRFGGQGFVRPVYFFVLISHIAMSIVGFPLVLSTLFLAATQRFERHRKLARITFPIWLYVSVTGVAVFLFLKIWG